MKWTFVLIPCCCHLNSLFWPQWACLDVPPWCRRGWILWALAPSSWTSRLSPPGSSSSVRRRRPTRATACPARTPSPRPSPSDPTSTASSSSCESHEHFFISSPLWGNVLCFNCRGHFKPPAGSSLEDRGQPSVLSEMYSGSESVSILLASKISHIWFLHFFCYVHPIVQRTKGLRGND